MLLYLVQSASTLLIFSQTHKRVHLQECKHFKQLYTVPPNFFLFTDIHQIYQISSVPLEVKKEPWQYWRKTISGNRVKQPHNVNLSH